MWFFLAVLFLWGTTAVLGRQDEWVLPPLVEWGWWTVCLYTCGTAAVSERFTQLHTRVMGLFGFSLLAVYYTTMAGQYMEFLPTDADNPDLWPTVFLTVNLLGPLTVVSLGCMRATVQYGRSS